VNVNKITRITPACFFTTFVTTFGEYSLNVFEIFLKTSLKKSLFFFNSYYFFKVYVKNLAKNVIFKKFKFICNHFYYLKTNVTMFNECFCSFFTHYINFKLIHMFP
jgi:hypothetical protein